MIEPANQFNLSLNGYEGPIDLLLELAKKQKVDLSDISILELAEQYFSFIQKFKELNLEIAADYLVMASWLTYLKSRLLLPKDIEEDDYTAEELEAALKYQLKRLEIIQSLAKNLYARPLIGRDSFYRGYTDNLSVKYTIIYKSNLYDLIKSYSSLISKKDNKSLTIASSDLYYVEESIERLKNILGYVKEWTNFTNIIPKLIKNKLINKSAISSNFVASLELTKNGIIELQQKETFGNIFIRSKQL